MESMDPDQPVVDRILAGEERAFDELMERYKRPVLNFVYRMLGDAHEAEDVAQDSFVRAYQNLARFQPGRGKFSTWLFQVARNAALDRLRQRRRRGIFQSLEITEEKFPIPGKNPSDASDLSDLSDAIARAVGELPEEQRAVVVLAEYHDLSYAEIAAVMQCSVKSVEARLYRAKQFLRERLRKVWGEGFGF
jgi:RNA polymerase sigma-70 factor (ECF subfamily)